MENGLFLHGLVTNLRIRKSEDSSRTLYQVDGGWTPGEFTYSFRCSESNETGVNQQSHKKPNLLIGPPFNIPIRPTRVYPPSLATFPKTGTCRYGRPSKLSSPLAVQRNLKGTRTEWDTRNPNWSHQVIHLAPIKTALLSKQCWENSKWFHHAKFDLST